MILTRSAMTVDDDGLAYTAACSNQIMLRRSCNFAYDRL